VLALAKKKIQSFFSIASYVNGVRNLGASHCCERQQKEATLLARCGGPADRARFTFNNIGA